jgi:hypothetical protein
MPTALRGRSGNFLTYSRAGLFFSMRSVSKICFSQRLEEFFQSCHPPSYCLRSRREHEEGAPRGRVGIGWSGVPDLGQSHCETDHLFNASLLRHNPPGMVYQQHASKPCMTVLLFCFCIKSSTLTPPSFFTSFSPTPPPPARCSNVLEAVCYLFRFPSASSPFSALQPTPSFLHVAIHDHERQQNDWARPTVPAQTLRSCLAAARRKQDMMCRQRMRIGPPTRSKPLPQTSRLIDSAS